MDRLLARSALAIDGGRRRRHRKARGEPRVTRDVEALLSGLADASEDDVIDLVSLDARAAHDVFQDERREDDRMNFVELSIALPTRDRRPHGFHDHHSAPFQLTPNTH